LPSQGLKCSNNMIINLRIDAKEVEMGRIFSTLGEEEECI
jgi:hypothetical protein